MANETTPGASETPTLQATQVYILAAICLGVGLVIGYLFHGSPAPAAHSATNGVAASSIPTSTSMGQPGVPANAPSPHQGAMTSNGHMPSAEEMKQMADKQTTILLEKLKKDPNNVALLTQLGAVYHATKQYKQAIEYYNKAVQLDPKNVVLRTKLASSLFRSGDADGAIAQLNQGLSIDPKDANSLFDLGIIKLQGKHDSKGAVAAWQELLKSNPQLSEERKAMVQKFIADVLAKQSDQHKSARSTEQ
jgi:cytochrome c-type biogenesis protein CcmH/NrfG